MAKLGNKLALEMQVWIDARRRHHLSHAQIQMAREMGMNPKKFGKIDNHKQERWKAPLPIFIENLYLKRFGKGRPDTVLPIEELFRLKAEKKEAQRKARCERKAAKAISEAAPEGNTPSLGEPLPL
jgi:hypothetical protein